MADVSIQGNKSAFGSMSGAQALQTTTIPASQKQEITKTVGINFSAGNDFSIQLNYKKPDGTEGAVFVTPDSMKELTQMAEGTRRAENMMGASTPMTVMQNGKPLGTVDISQIVGMNK